MDWAISMEALCSKLVKVQLKKEGGGKMPTTIKKYSDEMEKQIVFEYLNGAHTKYLCEKYGFKTHKSITDKVKKYGYKVRTQREELMLNKPYGEFSMKKIDSEFKAYFLGLLITDGYVSKNVVGIDLTDYDCIEFLATSVGNKKWHSYKRDKTRKDRHRLTINNPSLVKEVARFGVVPNKTKTISRINLFDEEHKYLPYIVRGMIDGDGWIRKDGNEFFICTASHNMAKWIKATLENDLFMHDVKIKKADQVWQVRSADKYNINILKLIVYNKPFGMKRKYNLLHSEPSETIMDNLIRG